MTVKIISGMRVPSQIQIRKSSFHANSLQKRNMWLQFYKNRFGPSPEKEKRRETNFLFRTILFCPIANDSQNMIGLWISRGTQYRQYFVNRLPFVEQNFKDYTNYNYIKTN